VQTAQAPRLIDPLTGGSLLALRGSHAPQSVSVGKRNSESGMRKDFDIVVWGATGFTGALVVEYLLSAYGLPATKDSEALPGVHPETVRWAIGGRSAEKLEALCHRLGADIPRLIADSDDEASLLELARATTVVLSTVGPYARFGSKLVAACASCGTHYCDLTGEVQWMREMIDTHQAAAVESGARLVHTCGFDSIPSDLGTLFVHNTMRERSNDNCAVVKYRAAKFKGGFSGGTVASMMYMMEQAETDPGLKDLLAEPYALNPPDQRRGLDGPDSFTPRYDPDFDSYVGPFVMAGINTRVVRRSNALMNYRYGHNFCYDEATLMGSGAFGFAKSLAMAASTVAMTGATAFSGLRKLMQRFVPQPGEGPNEELRNAGFFEIEFYARGEADESNIVRATVRGDKDPGYGSTAKMIAESAICLALDSLQVGGGFWTPASAMGEQLIERLHERAGVTFEATQS